MYSISYSTKFKKAYKKISRNPRFKEEVYIEVISKLVNKQMLDPKFKDHRLNGKLNDFRECHLAPDILLIYKYEDEILVLQIINIGSHSDLF